MLKQTETCENLNKASRFKTILKSDLFEKMTTSLALIASWAGFVQAYRIFSLQNALALSLPAVSIGVLMACVGLRERRFPLVTSNVVGQVSGMLIIVGIMLY